MRKKIERVKAGDLMGMLGETAPQWVAKELNKIIDHLNTQPQTEGAYTISIEDMKTLIKLMEKDGSKLVSIEYLMALCGYPIKSQPEEGIIKYKDKSNKVIGYSSKATFEKLKNLDATNLTAIIQPEVKDTPEEKPVVKKPLTTEWVCKICGGTDVIVGGDGTTHYYYCNDCEQATDLVEKIEDTTEEWEEELEDLFYDKEDLSSVKKFIKLLLEEKEREVRKQERTIRLHWRESKLNNKK